MVDKERQRGDPSGRRLWRAKADKLSESYAVANLLASMLSNAGVDAELCERLLAEIEQAGRIAHQRAQGRVEPRKRYKGQSSRAVQENRPVNCLYIDESGVSNREPLDTPKFFALGAVAIDDEEVSRYCKRADAIKQQFFRKTNFTFHEPDMRRHNEAYSFGGDIAKQREFDDAVGQLIWVAPAAFRSWLETGLRFVPKRGSDPTELADIASRDLYEWVRSGCTGNPTHWQRLSRKVYCRGDGQMGKFGIKVFPDHDIRERIEEHRRRYGAKTN